MRVAMINDEGIVIREHRNAFDVETDTGVVVCTLRSKLRKTLNLNFQPYPLYFYCLFEL